MSLALLRGRPRVVDGTIATALVVSALALRYVNYTSIVAYPDEFTYLYRALTTIGLNWSWSKQFMVDQPPIYMYSLSMVTSLWNGQLDTLRLLSVVAGSVTAPFVYLLGKSVFNRTTGLAAGVLFAFNGLDILYSRLAQQEALTILLIVLSLYFFWTGVAGRRSMRRAVAGGVFLGLAIDTKYIALIVPFSYLVYIFWTGKDWGSFRVLKREWWSLLLSKEFVAHIMVAFLVVLPVLLILQLNGVNAFYWDLLGKFVNSYSPFYRTFNFQDALFHALSSYSGALSFVSPFNPGLVFPLAQEFSDVAFLALIIVMAYYILAFFRGPKEERFLSVLFGVSALIFLIYPSRFQYYQLYTFPAMPIMAGHLLDRARRGVFSSVTRSLRRVRPSAAIVFMVLFLFVSMGTVAGAYSAVWGHGAEDDLLPFFHDVKAQQNQNVTIAVTPISGASFVSYYLAHLNITARIVELSAVGSAADPPSVRILEAPIQSNFTYSLVITLAPLSIYHPQYVVLGQDEYQFTFTTAMKSALGQSYQPMMSTPGFLIFQRIGPH